MTSLDGYPYHIILYGGAKGKNLTSRVVIVLIIETKNFKSNLAFDNCHSSMKLLSLLNALEIQTVCKARADQVGDPRLDQ